MLKNAMMAATALMGTALLADAHASDWFPGQTGQYHLIPDGQDVQDLTLLGDNYDKDLFCSGAGGVTLFAVDENGVPDSVPFVIPSRTVFVLTDAVFTGTTAAFPPPSGITPVLNISQNGGRATASFLANRPLQGGNGVEYFAGSGSLATGAAIAANAMLCAWLGTDTFYADQQGLKLGTVTVHGKLIDNSRTTSYPYLSW